MPHYLPSNSVPYMLSLRPGAEEGHPTRQDHEAHVQQEADVGQVGPTQRRPQAGTVNAAASCFQIVDGLKQVRSLSRRVFFVQAVVGECAGLRFFGSAQG